MGESILCMNEALLHGKKKRKTDPIPNASLKHSKFLRHFKAYHKDDPKYTKKK